MDVTNITHNIRVDAATKKGSVIDVIRIVCPEIPSNQASTSLTRLASEYPHLASSCCQLRIGGKGKLTPCADAKTLVEIVWLLPGKAAREFRRSSAQTVCRVLGGDLRLVQEIEARHHALEGTEEGQATREFLLDDDEAPQRKKYRVNDDAITTYSGDLPMQLQLASDTQKTRYFDMWMQQQQQLFDKEHMLKQQEVHEQKTAYDLAFVKSGYDALATIGLVDQRDKIAFSDAIRRIVQEHNPLRGSETTLAIATEVVPADDPTIPTPECHVAHRGEEISMHSVASKYDIRIPRGKEGSIGKRIKALYSERYGTEAGANIPKRNIPFQGQIFAENTYWSRDESLIKAALTSVCC